MIELVLLGLIYSMMLYILATSLVFFFRGTKMNDLEEKLFKCYGDSDTWRESAQANYEEACKHRKAAEELYTYLILVGDPTTEVLEQYKEYSK